MDQKEVLSIAKGYASSVRKVLPTRGIYLYGSYARVTAGKDSDIDIAVIVDDFRKIIWGRWHSSGN